MDYSAILERLRPHWLPIVLGLAGVIFLIVGFVSVANPRDRQGEITFEAASTGPQSETGFAQEKGASKSITVDVSGAVEKPGVYDLPADARVQDALIAAGGMSGEADREFVAKNLNLAAKVTDGGKVYIPVIGDPSTPLRQGFEGQAVAGVSDSALININTASASELDKLQGVGPVTAEKIISNRPYASIDELVSKKVVGEKVFNDIKDKISVY